MNETQVVVHFRIEKRADDPQRGVLLDQIDGYPYTDLSNPQFAQFENGTIVEAKLRVRPDGIRMVGVARAIEVPAEPSDLPNQWVQVGTEWFAPDEWAIFDTAMSALDNETFKIMICGPSGFGKTSRAKAWALAHEMKYVRINCALIRDPEEWFIYREIEDGDTVVKPTDLTRALQEGNAVVVFDEVNRLEPWLANSLFSLLDMDQEVNVHGMNIRVGNRVLFCFTRNEGHQYVGTFSMDLALNRRMDAQINVNRPPQEIEECILRDKQHLNEEQAQRIITVLNNLRNVISADSDVNLSTGPALKIARLVSHGRTMREAFQYVVINPAHMQHQKDLLDIINSQLGK